MRQIEFILNGWNIKDYTINEDGSVDVNGDVDLSFENLDYLPIRFRKINGFFVVNDNNLTSVENFPTYVECYMDISHNKLTDLTELKTIIGEDLNINHNLLKSNYTNADIKGALYTNIEEDGLIIDDGEEAINYKEWQQNKKRSLTIKKLLND